MSALALGLIAALAWGFHDICVRYVSQKTPLLASLLTVLCTGLLFHLGVMALSDGFRPVDRAPFGLAVLAGLFFLIASLGLYGAFQRGPVRLVSPIIASFPILSVAWAAANGSEVTPQQWAAVLVIVAGVSLVAALSDDHTGDVPPKGRTILYSAIAAIGFAGTFAAGQLAAEQAGDLPVTLITRVTAIVVLLAIITSFKRPFWPGRKALGMLSLMGIADGIALISVISAAGLPNAQYAAVASSIFGLLTIILAWAILRERMTPMQWFGCAVTFAGIGYLAL